MAATLLRCVGGHGGPSPGRGFRPPLSSYDVVWRDASYPGAEFGTSSMPVGNGDAAANVWWHDGALFALLAKGDAWTEWHDLFKIGRLRIALDPPPPSEANLSLTMSVATASVELRMPGVSARVWMDGPPPLNVLRVELNVTAPTTLSVELQRWRNRTRQWGDAQQGYSFYCPWHNRTTMPPDTIVPPGVGDAGGDGGQEIVWYHRNLGSSWRADLSHQGLGHALNLSADPFLHRTFRWAGGGRRLLLPPRPLSAPPPLRAQRRRRRMGRAQAGFITTLLGRRRRRRGGAAAATAEVHRERVRADRADADGPGLGGRGAGSGAGGAAAAVGGGVGSARAALGELLEHLAPRHEVREGA